MECFACDDENIQVHVTSAEEQDAVLSDLDDIDAIKALVPLTEGGPKTEDEKKLYELLTGLSTASSEAGSLNDLDGGELHLSEPSPEQPAEAEAQVTDTFDGYRDALYDAFGLSPVLTLTLSCIAATLALGCFAGLLYLKYLLFGNSDKLGVSADSLSQLEKQDVSGSPTNDATDADDGYGGEKLGLLFLDVEAPEPSVVVTSSDENVFDEKAEGLYYPSDDEDLHEKFHDAVGTASPLVFASPGLPRIHIEHSDPDCLPLPINGTSTPYSTPPPTPPRSALRRLPSQLSMRDASPSSPLSKPAWSLRASDAPALGLPSSPLASPHMRAVSPEPVSIPGAFVLDEEQPVVVPTAPRRAYRAPVPELDIAFAMQLRPGLGLGADPAWLVRFLMAMFGWMTVLIGGNGSGRSNRRAITV